MSEDKNKPKKEEKKDDVLDQLRKAEKVIKLQLLMKQLATLKKLAKDVLITKEKSILVLKEIGMSDEDIKRVIDFVNSLPEVMLTKEEKEDLRNEVKEDVKEKKIEIEKKIEDMPINKIMEQMTSASASSSVGPSISGSDYIVYNDASSINLCNSVNNDKLELKL